MKNKNKKLNNAYQRSGLALVVIMVILIVLSSIVYALSAKIATAQHRRQYLIDYQDAQYAANSAMKYALANIEKLTPTLIERNGSPDFSYLFMLTETEYKEMLEEWAIKQTEKLRLELEQENDQKEEDSEEETAQQNQTNDTSDLFALLGLDITDPNMSAEDMLAMLDEQEDIQIDPNDLEIPGPYGHPWPQVTQAVQFNINDAKITIEYQDENAKMPLTWAITTDKRVNKQAQAALKTFGEWMQMDENQIEELAYQLKEISEIKQFTINPKDITETTTVKNNARTALQHTTDFAKLLHSQMLDLSTLAIPLPDTGQRYEAPIKYLALWGSQRVNINTAPRHVLEAAFTFGGDAVKITDEIVILRQEKPFTSIDDLKSRLLGFSNSISRAANYITTESKYFSIQVTATSGRAKASAVATVLKGEEKFERIAIITQ